MAPLATALPYGTPAGSTGSPPRLGLARARESQGLLYEGPDPEGVRLVDGLLVDGLLEAVDRVNRRFGKRSVTFAAEGTAREEGETESGQPWAMRRQMKSPAYTTRWGELPEARLG